ncbi:hypothetical protein B005_1357 [Nocardiopsis alba ATCC BAA-2165]|uniref:Uncharacterized protein n=1 Tax=Nocardiopsis alba (strain ATCC BAA-2165 / BE74) TaxID=1205910 RepID=J7LE17_NOCAA|nr:hypothetical protein B005_1357 [Nocardiopsis alba ATCC BAA-2165]
MWSFTPDRTVSARPDRRRPRPDRGLRVVEAARGPAVRPVSPQGLYTRGLRVQS